MNFLLSFFFFVCATSFLTPVKVWAFKGSGSFLDLTHPKTRDLEVASKSYKGQTDHYFRDLWGREVLMRGWNVSGMAKNGDYLSFKNAGDAEKFLEDQKAKVGTNVLRWMFQWPGVEKSFREYDDAYLEKQVKQMKEAIKLGMYIFIDFHQDAFSKSIKDGYNGTPEFVVDWMKVKHKDEGCWLLRLGKIRVKCFVWSMSYFFNRGVKDANTKFWNNANPNALCAGTYNYSITDANGCMLSLSSMVIEPNPLTAQIMQNANDLDALVSGGTPTYTYLWNTGEITASITPTQNGTFWIFGFSQGKIIKKCDFS